MCVAGCPNVSLPHRGLDFSLRTSASTIVTKRENFFCSFTSSLSGISFPAAALAAPLPLHALGAMAYEKGRGIKKQWECSSGEQGRRLWFALEEEEGNGSSSIGKGRKGK